MDELAVRYEVDGQEIEITPDDVKNVLCDNPNVTLKETRMFLELCRAHKLNPFIKEAYLIKYGNSPATIVTGKDTFTKRAQKNPKFQGLQAGVTFISPDGALHRREGSMLLQGEQLVGGWCKVYVKGYENPMYDEVSYAEYVGTKFNRQTQQWEPNKQWATKPGTMIRKVAVVHTLREAFPDDFAGLYDEVEMGDMEPPAVVQEIPIYETYETDPQDGPIEDRAPMVMTAKTEMEAF